MLTGELPTTTPFPHAPTPRRPPVTPVRPDPYALIRKVLHAIAVLAALGTLLDWFPNVSHRWFILATAIVAACEVTAFALRPPETARPSLDAMEVGVRFVSGGLFGAVSIPLTAWILNWTETLAGLAMLALAGAVVCGGLAVRFGEEFWRWVRSSRNPF